MAIFEKPMKSAMPAVSSTISPGVKYRSRSARRSSSRPEGSPRNVSVYRMTVFSSAESSSADSKPSSMRATRSSVSPSCFATAKRTLRQ